MSRRWLFVALLFSGAVLLRAEAPPAGVGFEQRIGARLPLATALVDAAGGRHALGEFFHGKPVVLYFGYARCPQLCSVVADGTVAALRQIKPTVGSDLAVISLSIDPSETLAENNQRETDAVRRYGHAGSSAGWHFLTGSEAAIRAIADAAGFHYTYDPRSKQYAHPSGFLVVTPDGVVSRYFLGVDFVPTEVAQSLARAANGQTGQSVVDLLLLCFRGGVIGGRYGAIIWRTLSMAVVLTVLALAGGIAWMLRNEWRTRAAAEEKT
jgi:protein SCO1/2